MSEGSLDAAEPDWSTWIGGPHRRGAVRLLVERILAAHWNRDVAEWEIESAGLPRVHELSPEVTGYERKVELAIVEAAARECTCVVIVVDQDGPANAGRLNHLAAGRQRAVSRGHALADWTAVGVAVHMVETWLLADELAINSALAPNPPASTMGSLEELYGSKGGPTYPKGILRAHIAAATHQVEAPYDAVAACVRLEILEQRCPAGFARLADELRARSR